jgi:oligosaccharide repeat unit polymerase
MHFSLIFINYYVSQSALYPPTVFVTLWSLALFFLVLSGDFFYPISAFTLLIFTLGSLAFSLGGLFAMQYRYSVVHQASDHTSQILDLLLIFLIIISPLYFMKLQDLSAMSGVDDYFIGLRAQTSTGLKENEGVGIFAYIVALANFAALAAFSETFRSSYSKLKAWLFLVLAFSLNLNSAGRFGAFLLLFSLTCVYILRKGIKLKMVFTTVFIFVLVFSVPAVLLGKGGNLESSLSENVTSMVESLQIYTLSGLIAFDQTILNPGETASNNRSFRFFFSLLNSVGFDIELESINLEFIYTPHLTNIYTIYFTYYSDFGLLGLVVIMFLLGFAFSIFYRFAKLGGPEFIFLYSLIFGMLLLTLANEPFLTGLSYLIQAVIFALILYNVTSLPFFKKYKISRK